MLEISRPEGVAGQTLTVDRSTMKVRPGKRATDVELRAELRSSQGGQHVVTLPEGAVLQRVAIDGRPRSIRRTVALFIRAARLQPKSVN